MMQRYQEAPALPDEQIIELYWQREESAIRETDRKYGGWILRLAENILHDHSDAEECRNDTYLGAWNAIPPTRPRVFQAFLSVITRNIAMDRYRQKASHKRVPSELTVSMEELEEGLHGATPPVETPEEAYRAAEVGRLISDFVRRLNQRQRFIFIGRFYMADPVKDIAGQLGISASAVYQELDKMKKALKMHLEKNGVYV